MGRNIFNIAFNGLRKITAKIYDEYELASKGIMPVIDEPKSMVAAKKENKIKNNSLLDVTCEKTIKVGRKIPLEVTIKYGENKMAMSLHSDFFNFLFLKELKKLQAEDYEFSNICKNENELNAIYNSIKINCERNGYNVQFIEL